jgi:alkanesulfonate monooxygenase SsuD/methylene tetrahydromethanopterin reductase-like flavin-dependent oxidoreductase (luciferase family)
VLLSPERGDFAVTRSYDRPVPKRSPSVKPLEVGLVLYTGDVGSDRVTARWEELRALALRAEEIGFDTVWAPDELLWRRTRETERGFWDGVAMMGALAAVTSRIKVGSWVMSALHRNPGIVAKAVETIDEISGGRFVFGLGAGHEWPGQATAFGLPEDQVYARFEEALEVIVPLLRGGHADFEGKWHAARNLPQRPVGPRPNGIPIMIGGHGPKGMRHAAKLADIWSCYVEEPDYRAELTRKVAAFNAACAEVGRDPESIGRSAGIDVAPLAGSTEDAPPNASILGTVETIADGLRELHAAGFSQLELILTPQSMPAVDAMAPMLEVLRSA